MTIVIITIIIIIIIIITFTQFLLYKRFSFQHKFHSHLPIIPATFMVLL